MESSDYVGFYRFFLKKRKRGISSEEKLCTESEE